MPLIQQGTVIIPIEILLETPWSLLKTLLSKLIGIQIGIVVEPTCVCVIINKPGYTAKEYQVSVGIGSIILFNYCYENLSNIMYFVLSKPSWVNYKTILLPVNPVLVVDDIIEKILVDNFKLEIDGEWKITPISGESVLNKECRIIISTMNKEYCIPLVLNHIHLITHSLSTREEFADKKYTKALNKYLSEPIKSNIVWDILAYWISCKNEDVTPFIMVNEPRKLCLINIPVNIKTDLEDLIKRFLYNAIIWVRL